MNRLSRALTLALLGLLIPSAALAAPSSAAKTMRATLQLSAKLKKDMHFEHAMGGATLKYGKTSIVVNVTTSNLPAPSVIHKMAYVVWVTNGSQKESIGALKMHSNMASLKSSTMWHTVQDVVVTAESNAHAMKPSGTVVLSGMVG